MILGTDIRIQDCRHITTMSETVEGGSTIAWRLLATLEGGSLLLAVSALLAYTARGRARIRERPLPCTKVAITNSTNELGREIRRRLEAHGCVVSTVTSGTISEAGSDKYDALIVVGATPKADSLDGIADLVTEDVYSNIKLLESLSARVNCGGRIAWASMKSDSNLGAFGNTADAFDAVLQASLVHVAKVFHCVPIWVGRCDSSERTAGRVVAALMTCDTKYDASRFSIRNAAQTVGEYLYRWLKIIT